MFIARPHNRTGVLRTTEWYAELPPPMHEARIDAANRITLRHFRDTGAAMDQPALHDGVLVIHLGGPKRVTRRSGKASSVTDVAPNALTLMPALHAYRWNTEGPVEYAHLTLSAGKLHQVALEEFDRAPADLELYEAVGVRSPMIEQALLALLADLDRPRPGKLYRESLLTALFFVLLRDHSSLGIARNPASSHHARGGLPGWALGRVVQFMHANLHTDIALADLVAVTGLSRAQFFRAFKQSTGLSPRAYISTLRQARARTLDVVSYREARPERALAAI